jgi:carboxyl-terminal processing protease
MTAPTFEPLSRPRTIVLAGVFLLALVTGGALIHRGPLGVTAPTGPVNGARLFDEVRTHISTLYIDTLSDAKLYRDAIDGMVSELGDPYSVYLPPDRLEHLTERTSGNYAGIGIYVDSRDGVVIVTNPVPGSPGEQAGLLTGDRIAEIDGKSVDGWSLEEVQQAMRGNPGSTLKLTVERAETLIPFHVVRKPIHQSAIRHAMMLPSNVGYVELRVFSDSTVRELRAAVDSLVRVGAKSLILDVRANPGGLLTQGVRATDLFLDKGKRIVSTRGRTPEANHEYDDSVAQRWPSLSLAVLVDDKTASAAEILAGALQDHDRAVIVGLTTYGKGSAQVVYPLDSVRTDSVGALKLTIARWYTPVGRTISRLPQSSSGSSGRDVADARPKFKTDAGRTVLGGGGISPDLVVGDTAISAENQAFMQAVGKNVEEFRDALIGFALDAKASHSVTSPSFVVTPKMLDEVYKGMVARGVSVPRGTYDDVSPLISRLLSYEVARYVFGADAQAQRKAADDKVLIAAQGLLAGAKSQAEVLERAENAKKQPSKASVSVVPRGRTSSSVMGRAVPRKSVV